MSSTRAVIVARITAPLTDVGEIVVDQWGRSARHCWADDTAVHDVWRGAGDADCGVHSSGVRLASAANLVRRFVSEASVRSYLGYAHPCARNAPPQPLFVNIAKRQVPSPKVYASDSGMLHRLLGIAAWNRS